jgi:hypothetical protein
MPGAAFRAAIALLLAATGAAMAQPGVSDTTAYARIRSIRHGRTMRM